MIIILAIFVLLTKGGHICIFLLVS